ncbi:MAG: calcium-binding protein [Hellea sp.]
MYFLDRFNSDNLFSFNFDALDVSSSFKAMDMALAAPRFTELSPLQGVALEAEVLGEVIETVEVVESVETSESAGDSVAPDDGVNAPTPPGPLFAIINGTAGNDVLNGTASPDTINGLAGNDTIDGGGGADTINGGDGDDYMILMWNQGSDDFFGGAGSDTLDLSDPNFTGGLNFDLQAGTYQFGTADSVENVRGTQNSDNITGSSAANDLRGNDGNDTINALGGNDTIYDGNGDDVVDGGAGNDTFVMGQGADTLNGGTGNDLFDYFTGFDTSNVTDVDGGTGTDTFSFVGFGGNYSVDLNAGEMRQLSSNTLLVNLTDVENISAGDGNDVLTGDNADNVLNGGGGNDIIDGGFGLDTMDGGTGIDTLDVSFFSSTYVWNMVTGVTNFGGETAINFENAIMGAGDDDITGTAGNNIIDGGDGGDTLDGAGGTDTLSYARSDAAVSVDLGFNTASGGHADGDSISNFENLIGSDFDDDLTGTSGANVLDGGDGNDTINSGNGNDTMNGGAGDDLLEGSNGVNVYNGDAGDDTLQILGFTAGNTFDGGADNDTFSFETFGSDYIANLNTGVYDRVATGQASTLANIENITAGAGDDILTGNGQDNILIGGSGNDTINALTGTNTVDAGSGNDTVIFQSGANLLGSYDGGSGTDTFDAGAGWSNLVTINLTTGFVNFVGDFASLANFENVIVGGDGNIVGDSGNNVLTGLGGDNTIAGMAGADTMDGGAGIDTLDYSASNAGVNIDLNANTASGGHAAGDVISNFENVDGSDFDDVLVASILGSIINGGEGNDTMSVTGGLNGSILQAGGGDDILWSAVTMNSSLLNGDGGNDEIHLFTDSGLGGTGDTGNGGSGNDIIYLESEVFNQTANGEGDTDTLTLQNLSGGYTVNLTAGTVDDGDASDNATFSSIEIHVGSTGDDIYNGGTGNDTIFGYTGADTLNGGAGNDVLDGGGADLVGTDTATGHDIINGGSGNDTIIYSRTGSGSIDVDTNDGGSGTDTFVMSHITTGRVVDLTAGTWSLGSFNSTGSVRGNLVSIENVRIEGNGDVDVRGDSGANDLSSTSLTANNEFEGMGGNDNISAGGGNDRVEGGAGEDDMDGGAGIDLLDYASSSAGVNVNLGTGIATGGDADGDTFMNFENIYGSQFNDILTGDANANTLEGDLANDRLDGGAGDDILLGGDGADTLLGGAGADVMDGGVGFDSVDYRAATSRVVLNLDTGGTLGDAAGDTYFGIERVYGSDFNDTITGTAANEFFYGEDGNDTINAGDGIDRLYGGDGNDIMRGDGGNDQLYGSAGNDQLNGGTGFDIANYRDATSSVVLNLGTGGTLGDAAGDTYFGIEAVYGSDFNDILAGNNSANELRGWGGNDILNGAGGNDRLFGGAGADALNGGTGVDIAVYTDATSAVTVNLATVGTVGDAAGDTYSSIEWVWGSAFNDIITGDTGNNRLEGRDGNDTLNGGDGNDRLLGGEGDDTINGGNGVDTIFGQNGNDNLIGAGGNDFFFGSDGGDTINGGLDFDTVSYLASTSAVGVDLQAGGFIGDANGDTYSSIERVFGSQHDDYIVGSNGANTLLGNGGSDYLEGGLGNDSLFGGAATDSFGYDTTNGDADVISDFSTAGEVIYILGGDTDFDTFAEVQAAGTDAGANVIFDFGGGNTLTIVGQNLADLNAGDFDFSGPPPAAEMLDDPGAYASEPLSFDQIVAIHQAFAADANEMQLDDMLI